MTKKEGIAAIVFFVFITYLSIVLSFDLGTNAAVYGIDSEIALVILVESILLNSTVFLIPGILGLLGKKFGAAKCFYALIPVIILLFFIYIIVVAILAPTSFISIFIEFLGFGIFGAVILSIILLWMIYYEFNN